MFDTRLSRLCLFAALLIVVGCGDDPVEPSPFEGTWQELRHTRNVESCDAEGDPVDTGYFRLAPVGDGERLDYYSCGPEQCSETVNESNSFDEKSGDTWRGVSVESVDRADSCDFELTEREARVDGGTLIIEIRLYSGEVDRPDGQDCDEQYARDSKEQLECGRYEYIEAVAAE